MIFACVAFLVSKLDVQSVDDYYTLDQNESGNTTIKVTLSIDCATILDNYEQLEEGLKESESIPEDGTILEPSEFVVEEGSTVFDVLKQATREYKIQMEYQGADQNAYGSVYIQGIQHIYEFSCGPLSGWMYLVNGDIPDYGTSKYVLKDGDQVEFRYTCELGKDLGRLVNTVSKNE